MDEKIKEGKRKKEKIEPGKKKDRQNKKTNNPNCEEQNVFDLGSRRTRPYCTGNCYKYI